MDNFDVNRAIKYFQDVVTSHYTDFTGRVSRRDFWTFIAVYVVIGIAISFVGGLLGLYLIRPLYGLALLLPTLGMNARRIQDTGRSGAIVWIVGVPAVIIWLAALIGALSLGGLGLILSGILVLPLALIALLGAIYLIYLCIQPGTPGDNAFGPPPPVATAPGVAA